MLDTLTNRAFDARLAQLTGHGFAEYDFNEWTAFFDVQHDQPLGDWMRWRDPVESVRLVGAWREDADGHLFAGNASEVLQIVGREEVERWERHVWSIEDGE